MRIKIELKELMIVSLEQNANVWIHTSLNTPWRKTGEETRIVKPRFIKKTVLDHQKWKGVKRP